MKRNFSARTLQARFLDFKEAAFTFSVIEFVGLTAQIRSSQCVPSCVSSLPRELLAHLQATWCHVHVMQFVHVAKSVQGGI